MSSKTIRTNYLARVEGEGGLYVKVRDDKVREVQLNIFEPPRFFEAFLQGRAYSDAPDITARICGICPVAYQMSACHAMERAFSVTVDGPLRDLRRLLYCGEWIESHVLHVYMLHAPDFLGYDDAIQMANDHPEIVTDGLRLKKLGNEIVRVLAGREIHPINVRVGGFYRAPARDELHALLDELYWARGAAEAMTRFTAGLSFMDFDRDYTFVALHHPDEYPFNEGRLISNNGLDIEIADYESYFHEEHVAHSTALHGVLNADDTYHVGPLARYNLNFDRLPDSVRRLAEELNVAPPLTNPFKSIIARSLETYFAVEEAIRIIEGYEPPPAPYVPVTPQASTGWGCTEAPRGILYHRYDLDTAGKIINARIVPPTSQNQRSIEADLKDFVELALDLPKERLTWHCEQAVRNYDPCISCSTHFLKLELDRA